MNSSNRAGIRDKLLTLQLNQTDKRTATTDQNGNATWTINLSPQANNTQIAYNVLVNFGGDQNKTVTAYLYDPYGTRYAASSTIQYNTYKPSTNSTSLFIYPQTTRGALTIVSVEKFEGNVKQRNWLQIDHEFSWSYPWYRMHVKVLMGNTLIHVAFSPFLPGGEQLWSNGEVFTEVTGEFLQELTIDMVMLFTEYALAKGFSLSPPTWPLAAFTLFAKGATQLALTWLNWDDLARMLATALVSFIMGLIAIQASLGMAFINLLFNMVGAGTMSALYLIQNKLIVAAQPLQAVRTWVDGLEVMMDFTFGAAALGRYWGFW